MHTYIINSKEEFDDYFNILKDSAKIGSVPDIFQIGFDIEYISRSNYNKSFENSKNWIKNNNIDQACCIIQLATNDICFIVNLVEMKKNLPNNLINIIKKDCWVKFGVGVENDLMILSENFNLGHCGGGIELKNIALMAKLEKSNLEYLFNLVSNKNVKKSTSIHDWSKPLNKDELLYAAKDSIMSYTIGIKFFTPSIKYLSELKLTKSDNFDICFINNNNVSEIKKSKINYIGRLNEMCQSKQICKPKYIDITNYEKKSKFIFKCTFQDNETIGKGLSKKDAKQKAAELMYNILNS